MPGQDRAKQERLLRFAGWLFHKHRYRTLEPGRPYSEVRFTRRDLDDVPTLAGYGAEAGDAGEQAIHRDTRELRSFGVEVFFDESDQRWVSRMVPLTDAECRALAVAALSVIVEDGSATTVGYHVPGAGVTAEGAERIIAYAPVTDLLIEAIRDRRPVAMTHRGAERVIDPWRVFLTDGRWYVIGRDHRTDQPRRFALDAVSAVDFAGPAHGYEIPAGDYENLARTVGDPDTWGSEDPVRVTLEVDPRLVSRAEAILDARIDSVTAPSEWVPMSCTVRNVDAFLQRLWGLRARAVVTGPETIRSRVIEALREMT